MNKLEPMKPVISLKYPTYRDVLIKTVHSWFAGKRVDDNAEDLWRIHNSLYDLKDFAKYHPGGSSWIEKTKGTDITEAFEAHHISEYPHQLVNQFKVKDVSTPRNYTLTFHEDGFYKTLRQRIREKLKKIDHEPAERTDLIHTSLLLSTFILSVVSTKLESNMLVAVTGVLLCWTVIAAHNYFHRKDNWRMYTFNLSFMNFRDWRISHALSHHIYTNSFHDLEMSMFEPIFCWIPDANTKNWFQRYASWVYGPIIYGGICVGQLGIRVLHALFFKENIFYWDDLLPLSLPIVMYAFSGKSLLLVLITWIELEIVASFAFGLIGVNAAHHHPKIFHEGDMIRSSRDWGLFQVDAVAERTDIRGSQFLVLTHFGDHALHHLFPTLDHGILPQLYPVFLKTLTEFGAQLKNCNWLEHITGQHQQLARIEVNKTPPENEDYNDKFFLNTKEM